MQNAPLEYGCAGLGTMSVTRPPATVTSVPQHTEHSQQVLGTTRASPAAGASDSGTPLN
jgi:hypothetical protein